MKILRYRVVAPSVTDTAPVAPSVTNPAPVSAPNPPDLIQALREKRVHPTLDPYICVPFDNDGTEARFGKTTKDRVLRCDVISQTGQVTSLKAWSGNIWVNISDEGWLQGEDWDDLPQADLMDLLVAFQKDPQDQAPVEAEEQTTLQALLLRFKAAARDMATAGGRSIFMRAAAHSIAPVDRMLHLAAEQQHLLDKSYVQAGMDFCAYMDRGVCIPEGVKAGLGEQGVEFITKLQHQIGTVGELGIPLKAALDSYYKVLSGLHLQNVQSFLLGAVLMIFQRNRSASVWLRNSLFMLCTPFTTAAVNIGLYLLLPTYGTALLTGRIAQLFVGFASSLLTSGTLQRGEKFLLEWVIPKLSRTRSNDRPS